jgi:hypothetical protein
VHEGIEQVLREIDIGHQGCEVRVDSARLRSEGETQLTLQVRGSGTVLSRRSEVRAKRRRACNEELSSLHD